jgi:hypothetical protein
MSTDTMQAYQQPMDAAPGPIYVDTQHEDMVHDAQMDYYGAKLATCSSGTCDRVRMMYFVIIDLYSGRIIEKVGLGE